MILLGTMNWYPCIYRYRCDAVHLSQRITILRVDSKYTSLANCHWVSASICWGTTYRAAVQLGFSSNMLDFHMRNCFSLEAMRSDISQRSLQRQLVGIKLTQLHVFLQFRHWLQPTSEHDQPATILFFGIETAGFLHADHRINEFALLDLSGGKTCTFETLIRPEWNVPRYAAEANKITTELVCRPDVPRCVALPYIYAILDPPCSPMVTWIHISLERCVHRRWYLKINVK